MSFPEPAIFSAGTSDTGHGRWSCPISAVCLDFEADLTLSEFQLVETSIASQRSVSAVTLRPFSVDEKSVAPAISPCHADPPGPA